MSYNGEISELNPVKFQDWTETGSKLSRKTLYGSIP